MLTIKPLRQIPLLALLCACMPAFAAQASDLSALVNAYRKSPGECQGRAAQAAAALKPERALSSVRLGPGTILVAALDAAGYEAELVDAIHVTGPEDALAAFEALRESHCQTLLHSAYTAIGASRSGNEWTIVLARPMPDLARLLPGWEDAAREVLAATNAARARPQTCGERRFGPAPALAWNGALGQAALAHSKDMARRRVFGHAGGDGSDVGKRATRAGYGWRSVAENISFGQRSAEEAVEGWLASPGHCANLMNPAFTEMGAAYALRGAPRPAAYWTQVFGLR
ncbi:MAG TPA: CAP domain-containing protein [Telluria sp.]|nr:CAP domain-containing protein [Telluria sp.]